MPGRAAFDVASVNRESQNGGSYAARLMRHPLRLEGGKNAVYFFVINDGYDYRLEKYEVNCFLLKTFQFLNYRFPNRIIIRAPLFIVMSGSSVR